MTAETADKVKNAANIIGEIGTIVGGVKYIFCDSGVCIDSLCGVSNSTVTIYRNIK